MFEWKRDSYTIFEFDFGMDFDEHCLYRGRQSLTKINNGENVQSQWGKKIESCPSNQPNWNFHYLYGNLLKLHIFHFNDFYMRFDILISKIFFRALQSKIQSQFCKEFSFCLANWFFCESILKIFFFRHFISREIFF